jgi:hypothetical protein
MALVIGDGIEAAGLHPWFEASECGEAKSLSLRPPKNMPQDVVVKGFQGPGNVLPGKGG